MSLSINELGSWWAGAFADSKLQAFGYQRLMTAFSLFGFGPPSHPGFLKINAINRTFTHTTQIQILGTCDLIGAWPMRNAKRETRNAGAKPHAKDGTGVRPSAYAQGTLQPATGAGLAHGATGQTQRTPKSESGFPQFGRSPVFADIRSNSPIFAPSGKKI